LKKLLHEPKWNARSLLQLPHPFWHGAAYAQLPPDAEWNAPRALELPQPPHPPEPWITVGVDATAAGA
jgi:hypothetical protein